MLGYRDAHQRKAAAEELRRRGEPGATLTAADLLNALLRNDTDLRITAIRALAALGRRADLDALLPLALADEPEPLRLWLLSALHEAHYPLTEIFVRTLLSDPSPKIRLSALNKFGDSLPPDALESYLLAGLDDPDEVVRESIVAYWAQHGNMQPLVAMAVAGLQTSDLARRQWSVETLARLKERTYVEPLLQATYDEDELVRIRATEGLAWQGEHMPRERLRELLGDNSRRVQRQAAKALARQGDAEAIAHIIAMARVSNEWERENTMSALVTGYDADQACRELAQHLPVGFLLELLHDEWWPVGYSAAKFFWAMGDAAPVDALLELLRTGDEVTRMTTAYVLDGLETLVPLDALWSALNDESPSVRRAVADALAAFGDQVPAEALLPHLSADDASIAAALARLGQQEGIDGLATALRNAHTKTQAVSFCADLGANIPVDALTDALGDTDPGVQQWTIEALSQGRPDAIEALAPDLLKIALGQQDESVRQSRAARVLQSRRMTEVVTALWSLKSPDPVFVEWLTQALDWPYWETRMRAIQALRVIFQDNPASMPASIANKIAALRDDPESPSVCEIARQEQDTNSAAT